MKVASIMMSQYQAATLNSQICATSHWLSLSSLASCLHMHACHLPHLPIPHLLFDDLFCITMHLDESRLNRWRSSPLSSSLSCVLERVKPFVYDSVRVYLWLGKTSLNTWRICKASNGERTRTNALDKCFLCHFYTFKLFNLFFVWLLRWERVTKVFRVTDLGCLPKFQDWRWLCKTN